MKRVQQIGVKTIKTIIWPLAIYLVFFALSKVMQSGSFGSMGSIRMIAQQSVLNAMIALAMTCNMMNNRWDFSIGLMVVLSSIMAAPVANMLGIGGLGVVLSCAIAGLILGLLNGSMYLLLKIPSLVVSIGMMLVYQCACQLFNHGEGGMVSGMKMTIFGRSPYVFILGLVMGLIFYVLYSKTKFGYNVRSLAYGQTISNNIGINEKQNVIKCYALCGIFAGIAGAINLSVTGTVSPSIQYNNAMGIMFEAFPPVFIGLYLSRYTNLVVGIFIGSLTMKMVTSGILARWGFPSDIQNVGIGIFLLVFLTFTTNQARIAAWRVRRKKAASV